MRHCAWTGLVGGTRIDRYRICELARSMLPIVSRRISDSLQSGQEPEKPCDERPVGPVTGLPGAIAGLLTRPARARASGSETLSRIRFLAGSTIDTLESSFQKRNSYGVSGLSAAPAAKA